MFINAFGRVIAFSLFIIFESSHMIYQSLNGCTLPGVDFSSVTVTILQENICGRIGLKPQQSIWVQLQIQRSQLGSQVIILQKKSEHMCQRVLAILGFHLQKLLEPSLRYYYMASFSQLFIRQISGKTILRLMS